MHQARLPKTKAWLIHITPFGDWIGAAYVEYKGRVHIPPQYFEEIEKVGFRDFREPLRILDIDDSNFSFIHPEPVNTGWGPSRLIRYWDHLYFKQRDVSELYLIPIPEYQAFEKPEYVVRDFEKIDYLGPENRKAGMPFVHEGYIEECYTRLDEERRRKAHPFIDCFPEVQIPGHLSRSEKADFEKAAMRVFIEILQTNSFEYVGELHQYDRIRIERDQLISAVYSRPHKSKAEQLMEVILKVWDLEGDHLKPKMIYNVIRRAFDEEDDRYDVRAFIEYIDETGIAYNREDLGKRKKPYDLRYTSFRDKVQAAREFKEKNSL